MTIKRPLKDLDLKVRAIKPTARIDSAISSLARDDTSALVVTTDGCRVSGIISGTDIVNFRMQSAEKEVGLLRSYVSGVSR